MKHKDKTEINTRSSVNARLEMWVLAPARPKLRLRGAFTHASSHRFCSQCAGSPSNLESRLPRSWCAATTRVLLDMANIMRAVQTLSDISAFAFMVCWDSFAVYIAAFRARGQLIITAY